MAGWIWLTPVVFLIHDAEEIATIAPWLRAHASQLPSLIQPYATVVTTGRFALSVGVLLVAFVAAAWDGARNAKRNRRSWFFLLASGALAGNALTHAAQAVYFRGYTPGVVTALLLVVPFVVCLGRAFVRSGLVAPRQAMGLVALGVVVQAPIAAAALAAGGNLDRAVPASSDHAK